MENTKRGYFFEMFELALKVTGMVVTFFSTVVKAIDLIDRFKNRHQKSNRRSPK